MEIVFGDRRIGKTTYLLYQMHWMLEEEGVRVVCLTPNKQEAMDLLRLSRKMGFKFESWQFMSVEEARRNRSVFHGRHRHTTRVMIDDADVIFDRFLEVSLPILPSMVTWNAGPHSRHKLITKETVKDTWT